MTSLLVQIFLSLCAAVAIGFGTGLLLGRSRIDKPPAPGTAALAEVVEREATLIELISRADDDLRAHAVELADANEEIICLLDALHEARSVHRPD